MTSRPSSVSFLSVSTVVNNKQSSETVLTNFRSFESTEVIVSPSSENVFVPSMNPTTGEKKEYGTNTISRAQFIKAEEMVKTIITRIIKEFEEG